jgi:hypothetical protein
VADDRHVDQATVVTVDKPQRLPDQWYGYEGVDLLVIAGLPAVENLTIDAPAVDAIEHWVRLGGTLLVATDACLRSRRLSSSGPPRASIAHLGLR